MDDKMDLNIPDKLDPPYLIDGIIYLVDICAEYNRLQQRYWKQITQSITDLIEKNPVHLFAKFSYSHKIKYEQYILLRKLHPNALVNLSLKDADSKIFTPSNFLPYQQKYEVIGSGYEIESLRLAKERLRFVNYDLHLSPTEKEPIITLRNLIVDQQSHKNLVAHLKSIKLERASSAELKRALLIKACKQTYKGHERSYLTFRKQVEHTISIGNDFKEKVNGEIKVMKFSEDMKNKVFKSFWNEQQKKKQDKTNYSPDINQDIQY